jgi:hypothetical protein
MRAPSAAAPSSGACMRGRGAGGAGGASVRAGAWALGRAANRTSMRARAAGARAGGKMHARGRLRGRGCVQTDGLRTSDCRVKIWNMQRVWDDELDGPKMLCANKDHSEPVNCVRWSPCGQFLATCAGDKMVFVLRMGAKFNKPIVMLGETEANYENWEECARFHGHTRDVLHVAWCSKTAGQLASCGLDCNIFIWKMGSREPVKKIDTGMPCKGVSWDPMGKYLAAQLQGAEKTVCVWRVRDWKLEAKNADGFDSPDDTQFLRPSWAPDGHSLATVNAYESNAYVCTLLQRGDVKQGEQGWEKCAVFKGWKAPVTTAAFHPHFLKKSGSTQFYLAVGSVQNILTVWSTSNMTTPLCVIKNLFNKEICDVTWGGTNSYNLSCCSIDGSVALIHLGAEEVGTVASAEETKKELIKLYPYMDDGLGDMDLPEDTAQMQYEQLNAVPAPAASREVLTVLTEQVVRAEQKETKVGGRRKIAPAVTRQVSTVVAPALEPAAESSAVGAAAAANGAAAPCAVPAASSSAAGAPLMSYQVMGGGFGAAEGGGGASSDVGGGEAQPSDVAKAPGAVGGGGVGGGLGSSAGAGSKAASAGNKDRQGELSAEVAENGAGAQGTGKATASGGLGKRGAVTLKDGKDASKARRLGVYLCGVYVKQRVAFSTLSVSSCAHGLQQKTMARSKMRARSRTHSHTHARAYTCSHTLTHSLSHTHRSCASTWW